MNILIVEDDAILGQAIELGLRERGFIPTLVRTGGAAISAVPQYQPEAIILDLGLPDLDGKRVLQALRAKQVTLPILILTARDESAEVIRCLDAGADDYLVKPFHMDVLAARLRALGRRQLGHTSATLKQGEILLNMTERTCRVAMQPVALSTKEFDLLQLLVSRAGRVLTREFIEQQLSRGEAEPESNALEVHMHHLRKKLGEHHAIQTIRGIGYRWQA